MFSTVLIPEAKKGMEYVVTAEVSSVHPEMDNRPCGRKPCTNPALLVKPRQTPRNPTDDHQRHNAVYSVQPHSHMHYQRFLAYSTPTPQVLGGDPLPAAIQYRCLYTTTAAAKASANSTSFTG